MDKFQMLQLLADTIVIFKNIVVYAIIGRILISWFTMAQPGAARGRFSQFLHDITEPFMKIARLIPHRIGMIDFAPLIAIIGLDLLAQLFIILLARLT